MSSQRGSLLVIVGVVVIVFLAGFLIYYYNQNYVAAPTKSLAPKKDLGRKISTGFLSNLNASDLATHPAASSPTPSASPLQPLKESLAVSSPNPQASASGAYGRSISVHLAIPVTYYLPDFTFKYPSDWFAENATGTDYLAKVSCRDCANYNVTSFTIRKTDYTTVNQFYVSRPGGKQSGSVKYQGMIIGQTLISSAKGSTWEFMIPAIGQSKVINQNYIFTLELPTSYKSIDSIPSLNPDILSTIIFAK